MLDSFRTNMRTFALGIVIVIGFIFAFSGTGTMFLSGNSGDAAVVVGGEIVREIDVLRSISRQKQRNLSENEGIDPSVLDDSLIRPNAVEQLISRQLLVQASGDRRMTVSPREVDQYILDIESFQTDPENFDPKAFKMLNLLKGKEVKAAHARIIKGFYERDLAELEELASGKGDEQLREQKRFGLFLTSCES